MKFGVVFPQTQLGADPAALRDFAQAAEGMGYHHILAYDHVLGANPDRPNWDPGPPHTPIRICFTNRSHSSPGWPA